MTAGGIAPHIEALADDAWLLQHADGRRETARVQGRYHANNPEAVALAALAGLGVALLPV